MLLTQQRVPLLVVGKENMSSHCVNNLLAYSSAFLGVPCPSPPHFSLLFFVLGNKITVTPTNILLMAIVIVLFAILLTLGEKNEKEKKSSKEKKN